MKIKEYDLTYVTKDKKVVGGKNKIHLIPEYNVGDEIGIIGKFSTKHYRVLQMFVYEEKAKIIVVVEQIK